MKNIVKLMLLLPFGMVSTLQATTTFTEGSRDVVPLHPSCRTANTGLTAVGVMLPNGSEVKVTVNELSKNGTPSKVPFSYPEALITTNRAGDAFNGNAIMSASPSYNKAGIFGMDTIKASVPAYGSRGTNEDTRMVFWKLNKVNVYDVETNSLTELPYIPVNEFFTVDLGFSLPKFAPESCLVSMNVRGTQVARCDQIDPETNTIIAGSEPDIRAKRMRLIAERDQVRNPLPANCGKGISITVEPTDGEAEAFKLKMGTLAP